MPDLKLLTKTILLHEILPFESTCIPGQWIDPPKQTKLKVGVLSHDGIVTPHPPIQRALFEVTDKLRAAGHEGACLGDFGIARLLIKGSLRIQTSV